MIKKMIGMLIALGIILAGYPVQVFAQGDTPSTWAKSDVAEAIQLGLVPTTLQSKYQDSITREEFASLFVTTAFAYQKNRLPAQDTSGFGTHAISKDEFLENVIATDYAFTDTNSQDVKLAYMMGLINGTSRTTFSPKNNITRQEAAVMLVNYSQLSLYPTYAYDMKRLTDVGECADWAKDSVLAAFDEEFFLGTAGNKSIPGTKVTMSPKGNFTREQAIIVALRSYRLDTFQSIQIRSQITYATQALKIKWEISNGSVTAVGFKPGMTLDIHEDHFLGQWEIYSPAREMQGVTAEHMIAASPQTSWIYEGIFTDEMMLTAAKGDNAIFDLGYAEYEVNNPNYIFQYRYKNNGVHNHRTYGGSLLQPITFKRLK